MPVLARTRLRFLYSCVAVLVAAGCAGYSPTAPSERAGSTGAVIAGAVTNGQASGPAQVANFSVAASSATSPFAGLTVGVVGSNLSAVVGTSGTFEISGVPAGNVRLRFTSDLVNATTDVGSVSNDQFIALQVQVSGTSAVVVSDTRSQKTSICHTEGTGDYHLIDISESAEASHRAHGDAKVGENVPGQLNQTFGSSCQLAGPAVDIEKFTNDKDADTAPGPEISVGSTVTWTYVVKNTGTIGLTDVTVVDDQGVVVSCPSVTTMAPGATITCSGTGAATLGQYSNIGTVTAKWAAGGLSGTVTDSDASHYLGVISEEEGLKVTLCHKTGAGFYVTISVSIDAESAHRAHGDAKPGETVPGLTGKSFTTSCAVQ